MHNFACENLAYKGTRFELDFEFEVSLPTTLGIFFNKQARNLDICMVTLSSIVKILEAYVQML